jgi:hypothetical protein
MRLSLIYHQYFPLSSQNHTGNITPFTGWQRLFTPLEVATLQATDNH